MYWTVSAPLPWMCRSEVPLSVQAMIVGTDVPDISSSIIHQAEGLLDTHDVVFGPVRDGGYYLVATKAPHACLFQGMQWSTGDVLQHSTARAQQAGLSVAAVGAMPELMDVDTKQVWSCCLHLRRTVGLTMPLVV